MTPRRDNVTPRLDNVTPRVILTPRFSVGKPIPFRHPIGLLPDPSDGDDQTPMLEVAEGTLRGPSTHFTVLSDPSDGRPRAVFELVVTVGEEHEDEFVGVVAGTDVHRPVQGTDTHSLLLRFPALRWQTLEQ